MRGRRDGFTHQLNCTFDIEDILQANERKFSGDDENDTYSLEQKWDRLSKKPSRNGEEGGTYGLCKDPRCCLWFDLKSWFGYLESNLAPTDFEAAFTDVAHGGIGLYEKLIVLGAKTLDVFAEMHFYELFSSKSSEIFIPRDLRSKPEALRILWARVRTDRVCALRGLYSFGKSYMAAAQKLPSRQSVAKLLKACIGFSCQSRDSENLYKWLPILVEHIFWCQKLMWEKLTRDNDFLQDLQEYFGYTFNHLLPRIHECLKPSESPPQRSDTPTGRELLRLYATDYFTELAEEAGIQASRRALWVTEEVDHFFSSEAIPVFASIILSTAPYILSDESEDLPIVPTFVKAFENVVSACWILTTEEKARIWMPALIQRLRQIQLSLHMSSIDDKGYVSLGPELRKPSGGPVDLKEFNKVNNSRIPIFQLWNIDPKRMIHHPERIDQLYPTYRYMSPSKPRQVGSCGICPARSQSPQRPIVLPPSDRRVIVRNNENVCFELLPLGPASPVMNRRRVPSRKVKVYPQMVQQQAPSSRCCLADCFGKQETVPGPVMQYSRRSYDGDVWVPLAQGANDPCLKFRYVTENGEKDFVEVLVDDHKVFGRHIEAGKGKDSDFKAVLTGKDGQPVVLNFGRGDDGKPVLFVTGKKNEGEYTSPTSPSSRATRTTASPEYAKTVVGKAFSPPRHEAPQRAYSMSRHYGGSDHMKTTYDVSEQRIEPSYQPANIHQISNQYSEDSNNSLQSYSCFSPDDKRMYSTRGYSAGDYSDNN